MSNNPNFVPTGIDLAISSGHAGCETDAMLRNAARLARLGHWVWDHRLDRGVHVSEELAAIYRMTSEQYLVELGDPDRMLAWFHPDDRDGYSRIWTERARQGLPYEIDVRALTRDGEVRYCREIGEPVFDSDGRLLRTVGTFQDLTEQRSRDERIAEVLANSPAAVYVAEVTPPHAANFVSPNIRAITGHQPEAFVSDPAFWVNHLHPDDRECTLSKLAELEEREALDQLYRFRHADGTYRWLRDQARLRRDGNGHAVEAVGYITDVTDLQTAEAARRESEVRYRELFDHAPFGLYRASPEGRFREVNPAMARMFDCASPTEFLTYYKSAEDDFYVDPGFRARILSAIEEDGHVQDFQCAAWARDGTRLSISESARALVDAGGQIVGYEGCVIDITERHRMRWALAERVKELSCLYDIAEIRWNENTSLSEMLQAVADRLPSAFQHPASCCARIALWGSSYTSPGFGESEWRLASVLTIDGEVCGQVEVFYSATFEPGDEGPFLAEERQFLDRVADGLARTVRYRQVKAEAEQRAAMLRDAAALANLGFCVWDEEQQEVTFATDEMAQLVGLSPAAYRVRSTSLEGVLKLIHPADRAAYRRFLQSPANSRCPARLDYRIVRPDGSLRHLREIADPLVDAGGVVRQSVCTIQDITDFKAREAELRATSAFLDAQLAATPLGVITLGHDGRVTSANPAAERMFGWREDEMLGRLPPFVPDDDRAGLLDRVKAIMAEGCVQVLERVRCRRDGSIFEARIHTAPLRTGGKEPDGVLSIFEDVSQQNATWRALEASERRFRAVTDLLPVPVVMTEQESGQVLFANTLAKTMFRVTDEQVESVHSPEFYVDPDDRDRIRARIAETGEVRNYECQVRSRDGRPFWALATCEPVEFEGKPAYCSTFLDVTERKRMEAELRKHEAVIRQSQKMESLGTLAGGIAHDFNNILQPIMLFAEDVADMLPADSPAQDSLSSIIDAAERAAALVRQILDFSREEATPIEPHDIRDLVADAVHLVRRTIPSSVVVESELDRETGDCGLNPGTVTQILSNLAVNASDAMDGKGLLRIELEPVRITKAREGHGLRLPPGDYACLSVTDTGCGMPAWLVDRIFEPFFTTKPVGEGTGLGLSVVHGLVRQHDGAVFVATAPGEGTRFDIYLPILNTKGS